MQSRANLLQLYVKSPQDQREEYQREYEARMKKMWSSHHSTEDKEYIHLDMIHLINQRGQ